MKLNHKVYRTSREKAVDFAAGFFCWVLINGLLLWVLYSAIGYLGASVPRSGLADGNKLVSAMQFGVGYTVPFLLVVCNIVILIYFDNTRRWVTYGALSALVFVVGLVVLAAVLLASCVFFFCVF